MRSGATKHPSAACRAGEAELTTKRGSGQKLGNRAAFGRKCPAHLMVLLAARKGKRKVGKVVSKFFGCSLKFSNTNIIRLAFEQIRIKMNKINTYKVRL